MENLTAGKPPEIAGALAAKRGAPEDVFGHFGDGADLIVGAANGEPVTVLDALEAESGRLSGVTLHQMLALRKRRYMHGDFDNIRHVSWFLSPANRGAFHEGRASSSPTTSATYPTL